MQGNEEMEIIIDENFSFEGYQVVRGEFFAHIYEPSITFNNYKVSVNTACVKKLPEADYVQILVNPISKKLAVRPCNEDQKDSLKWKTPKGAPKQITCRVFYAKVLSLMEWNPHFRYKLLGKLIKSESDILFVFDLTTPEIFQRKVEDNGYGKISRMPSYPADWKNQFGVPVAEHQKALQVDIFKDYAVFVLESDKKKEADKHGTEGNSSKPEDSNGFKEEPNTDTQTDALSSREARLHRIID